MTGAPRAAAAWEAEACDFRAAPGVIAATAEHIHHAGPLMCMAGDGQAAGIPVASCFPTISMLALSHG